MKTCDAIVRSAGMENLQSLAEMARLPTQGDNRLDCRVEFLQSFHRTMMLANDGFIDPNFELLAPFRHSSKNDIARHAYYFGVPLHMTWSCYRGGNVHCGRCGTCIERLEAIDSVKGAPSDWDKTLYQDTEFWKEEVKRWNTIH